MGKPKKVRMPHLTWMKFKGYLGRFKGFLGRIRNPFLYAVATFFFLLTAVTFPYFPPPLHQDFVTQPVTQTIPFHFDTTATVTVGNRTNTYFARFDGQLVVSGKGGVSVENPQTIHAQVTVPRTAYVFLQKIRGIHVFPLGALHYPIVNNPNGIPEVENLTLVPKDNVWSASDSIIYPRSNETGDPTLANLTYTDIFGHAGSSIAVESHGIQVSPIDVTLAINNNLLTTSLTLAILGFAAFEGRKD